MKRIWFAFLGVVLTASLFSAEYREKIDRSFPLPVQGSFALEGINGPVSVTTSDTPLVRIFAIKTSDYPGDLALADVVIEATPARVAVQTRYRKENIRVRVEYRIVLPAGLARTQITLVNGTLDLGGAYGDTELKTVNGDIHGGFTFSRGSWQTVNGKVAWTGKAPLAGPLAVVTVNGAVSLGIHLKSDFTLKGETIHGSIESAFPVRIEREFVGRRFSGKVGAGTHMVEVRTVNGAIQVDALD
ncbi:MAG TPA: hypothetical protein PKK12_13365 [Candidatus Aminicenantes bacterium]|nr:hypothetical protein [Candidatus Aminicenantes bacterium]